MATSIRSAKYVLHVVRKARHHIFMDSRCSLCTSLNSHKKEDIHSNIHDHTDTIDKEEVGKFSRLADQWWDESGEFVALQTLNNLRIPWIRNTLVQKMIECGTSAGAATPKPLRGCSILDIGCGGGLLSEPLARLGASVVGVDASPENIETAKWHFKADPSLCNSSLSYLCDPVESIVHTHAETYDGVVASEILEHVADPRGFVDACCTLVKPGGSIFFTTLNKTLMSYALGVMAAEYILRIVPVGTHDWNKFISPQELQMMLHQNGCEMRLLHGMKLNPLTKKWSWVEDTSINYAIHAVKSSTPSSQWDTDSSDSSSDEDNSSGQQEPSPK